MKAWPIIVGLLAYCLFCIAAWEIYREPVDEKLEKKAEEALVAVAGTDPSSSGAEIEFRGMRGILRGIEDAEVGERLRVEIESAVGWGRVDVEMAGAGDVPEVPVAGTEDPESPKVEGAPTFAMRPGLKAGTWVMWGELPDDDLIDALVLGTRRESASAEWIDAENLRRSGVDDAGWLNGLPQFVNLLVSRADGATLEIDSGRFVVGGDVLGSEDEHQILEAAQDLARDQVVDRLRVSGWLEVVRGEEGLVKAKYHTGSGKESDSINAGLRKGFSGIGVEVDVESKISPDEVYCPDWMLDVAGAMAGLVGDREGGSVRIGEGKLVLGGVAQGDAERNALLALAREVAGDILEIEDALEVQQLSRLVVVKLGKNILLQGDLPDEESAGKLLAAIQGKFPLAPDIERTELSVTSGGTPPKWFPRAVATIPQLLGEIDAGQIEITGGGVVVFAGVRTAEARQAVIARAGEIAGGEIPIGDLEVLVLKAPSLGVVLDGEKIVLTGRLPSGQQKAEIIASIRGFLSAAEIDDQIEVDENVWDPEWFAAARDVVPEFLQIASGLGEAQMEVEGEKLSASARLPSDELKEPLGLLFSAFGRAGVKVDLKFEVLAQPRLIIGHSQGKTKIGGRLKGIETKKKFTNALSAAFPGAKIEDAVVIDEDAAESGWDVMVLDLVSVVMSELKEPGIDLRPGKVRIEGEVESEKERLSVEKRLVDEFGAAFDIESGIRLSEERLVAEPRFELSMRDGKWALLGMVASAEEKEALVKAIGAAGKEVEFIDELEVEGDVHTSPWIKEIGPLIAAVANARDPWISIFRGTVIVEGEFPDNSAKQRLGEIGGKLSGLKFEDASTVKRAAPDVIVPPPPSSEGTSEAEGNQ